MDDGRVTQADFSIKVMASAVQHSDALNGSRPESGATPAKAVLRQGARSQAPALSENELTSPRSRPGRKRKHDEAAAEHYEGAVEEVDDGPCPSVKDEVAPSGAGEVAPSGTEGLEGPQGATAAASNLVSASQLAALSIHQNGAGLGPAQASPDSEMKRKRGRPKGSKNKPKEERSPSIASPPDVAPDGTIVKRGRGRPKGSKNKPRGQEVSTAHEHSEEGQALSDGTDTKSPASPATLHSPTEGDAHRRRGRGRPKGSKNRPKPLTAAAAAGLAELPAASTATAVGGEPGTAKKRGGGRYGTKQHSSDPEEQGDTAVAAPAQEATVAAVAVAQSNGHVAGATASPSVGPAGVAGTAGTMDPFATASHQGRVAAAALVQPASSEAVPAPVMLPALSEALPVEPAGSLHRKPQPTAA
mmetsp:Transcript_13022/g.28032  ORF Transcript_13022/g.28032 Transcript_13022/m.28032 type:complete len:416 (-) Transcript_13022:870-2117(-)